MFLGFSMPTLTNLTSELAGNKKNIRKGEKLNQENIGLKRPAIGLEPKKLKSLLGKISKFSFKKDHPIKI